MYRLFYYKTPRGDTPFEFFLDGHNDKVRAKFDRLQKMLEEHGPELRRPYAGMLRDGIRELRVGLAGNSYRALYFFFMRNDLVITHAFVKKTDKVPEEEIARALRYKHDFLERFSSGEFEI